MKNLFREFFYFSRGERRGILMLMATIGIVLLSGYLISARPRRSNTPAIPQAEQDSLQQEYEAFIASVKKTKRFKAKTDASYRRKENDIPVTLAPFNPNTADSITFRRLGLPNWMARNILRYRTGGGKFRKADDFKKIYGMTKEKYAVLSPYIYIAPEDTARQIPQLYIPQPAQVKNMKYATGTVLDLNLTDTTELKKIPGIGSGIARQITGYRQQLGGFYRIAQLKEIHLDAQQLEAWFSLSPADIRRININRSGVERLSAHPYINFYQAKALVEYRKKNGTLTSLKPFSLYQEFTKDDLERISYYVCFE